ncbi:MAG: AI-2E family transporter [Clostridia bacterium]|nr:AI-2E family transporter [Clostridia bacterium]
MDFNPKNKKALGKWLVSLVTVCILIYLAVKNISVVASALSWCLNLVMPILTGAAIAIILNVPMRFFEGHLFTKTKKPLLQKLRRPVSFLLALIMILGILAGVILLVIPELVNAIGIVADAVIDFANKIKGMSRSDIAALPFGDLLLKVNWNKLLSTAETWLKSEGGAIVSTAFVTLTSLIGGILDFFIAFVFAIYFLFGKDKLRRQARRLITAWLPKKFSVWFIHAVSVANVNFRNFISGQSLEAVILGVLCIIGMWILGLPYAPMVGALVGVTALIPVVGAFVGAIVGAFMVLTVSPIKAVIFLVFLIILQQIEANLIYPRVMGSRVNLPAMWILAAITIGGGIYGAVGMLLSVPIASTLYILLKEATIKREAALNNKK